MIVVIELLNILLKLDIRLDNSLYLQGTNLSYRTRTRRHLTGAYLALKLYQQDERPSSQERQTFLFLKLTIYRDTASETDGLPTIFPVTSLRCQIALPSPAQRLNPYVAAARIFCAWL